MYLHVVDNSVENQLFLDLSNANIWSEIFQLRLNELTEVPPFTLNCFHSLCSSNSALHWVRPMIMMTQHRPGTRGLSSTPPIPQCIIVLKLPRSQSVTPLSLWLCTSHWFSSPYIHPFPQHFRLQIFVSARE